MSRINSWVATARYALLAMTATGEGLPVPLLRSVMTAGGGRAVVKLSVAGLFLCCGLLSSVSAGTSGPSKDALCGENVPVTGVHKQVHEGGAHVRLAQMLEWVSESADSTSICRGHYRISVRPPSSTTAPMTVQSEGWNKLSMVGDSVFTGRVAVTQKGRTFRADRVVLARHAHTQKIERMDLEGHVRMQMSRLLVWAQKARLEVEHRRMTAHDVVYRLLKKWRYAWGWAQQMEVQDNGRIDLAHVGYTTCPPINPAWLLRASHLYLKTQEGWGQAWNVALYVKRVPVLYVPYLTFPLDDRRKTGLLLPAFGYSAHSGMDVRLPFYWNMAPNYDMTLIPRFVTQRGGMMTGIFRFLTPHSKGWWKVFVMVKDRFFETFKQDSLAEFGGVAQAQPGLARLRSASLHRGAFILEHNAQPSTHWSTHVMVNLSSDDYVFFDFGNVLGVNNTTHLLNIADAHYQSAHWDVLGRVQGYQTLHPVNQPLVEDLYRRLPFLRVQGDFPHRAYQFSYRITGAYVHFDHRQDFLTGDSVRTGDRVRVRPSVRFPITGRFGFLAPQLSWQWTAYALHDAGAVPRSQVRNVPIVHVRGRMVAARSVLWGKTQYQQTLEPQLFYVWIPFRNQADIPVFDTVRIPFDWGTLFRENRFIGVDRMGDSNQISLGITTRMIQEQTGVERFHARIGQIYYFTKHRVCLTPDCSDDPTIGHHSSPFVAELQYTLSRHWHVRTALAWDDQHGRMNNSDTYFLYRRDARHILTLGYHFVRNGDVSEGEALLRKENHLNRFNIALSWPITQHWYGVGRWNYNISHGHPQTYYYGVEHQSCCWAMRMMIQRNFRGFHADGRHDFEHKYYVQFRLKGLGHIGNSNPTHLLSERIPGYKEVFSGVR